MTATENPTRLSAADVDLIRAALRATATNDKRTAQYDKSLPHTVTLALRERASAMGKLADRLKPHAPPELPEADSFEPLAEGMAAGIAAAACDDRR